MDIQSVTGGVLIKSLVLKHQEWDRIFAQIKRDYAHSPAVYLLRTRMRDELGFTQREHTHYHGDVEYVDTDDWRDFRSEIHIDFYSESARTMFMLRYMNRD